MAQDNQIDLSFRQNKKGTISSMFMAEEFNNCLTGVKNMINNDGPIYHTWISFQFGTKTDTVVFNTDTQNPNQNVIASLDMKKSGAGTCNEFTLKVVIDPFNFGQETQNQIEKLDDMLAQAMSKQIDTDDALMGYIQYGYITTSDANLVSPLYKFILTDADSNVDVSSGISNYVFKGTSYIAADCNFKTNMDKVDSSEKILTTVIRTLYKYYGDPENKPTGVDVDDIEFEPKFKYRIECEQYLIDDSATFADYDLDEYPAQSDTNPIQYCQKILEGFPLTQSDIDSGEWKDWQTIDYNARPRYDWWVTDNDGATTIHISHYNPKIDKNSSQRIIYLGGTEGITWGLHQKNIVVNWAPSVDLKQYLIRKASFERTLERLEKGDITTLDDIQDSDYKKYIKQAFEDGTLREETAIVQEFYDAKLTLVGIPADVPIGSRIIVIPRILESISRTKGTYFVKGATDNITNQGVYTTELELFRVDDDKGSIAALQDRVKAEKEAKEAEEKRKTDGTALDDFQRRDQMLADNGIVVS